MEFAAAMATTKKTGKQGFSAANGRVKSPLRSPMLGEALVRLIENGKLEELLRKRRWQAPERYRVFLKVVPRAARLQFLAFLRKVAIAAGLVRRSICRRCAGSQHACNATPALIECRPPIDPHRPASRSHCEGNWYPRQ